MTGGLRTYARMAKDQGLPWLTLESVFHASRAFLDPMLREGATALAWEPAGGWAR